MRGQEEGGKQEEMERWREETGKGGMRGKKEGW